jgi:hypothetical protein
LGPAIAAAAVLGLLLGVVLLIAWERADPRLDGAEALDSIVGCPRSELDQLSERSMATLLRRWQALASGAPARVALIPAKGSPARLAEPVAERLAAAGRRWGLDVVVQIVEVEHPLVQSSNGYGHEDPGELPPDVLLLVGAAPESAGAGEAVALSSDIAVLVSSPTSKARELAGAARVLARYGVVPSWAILASRRRTARGLARLRAEADVPEPV